MWNTLRNILRAALAATFITVLVAPNVFLQSLASGELINTPHSSPSQAPPQIRHRRIIREAGDTYTYALVAPPASGTEADDLALLNARGAQGFAFLYATLGIGGTRLLFEKNNGRNTTYTYALAPLPASESEADGLALLNSRGAQGFAFLRSTIGSYGVRYFFEKDNGRNATYSYALIPPSVSGSEADELALLNARGAQGFAFLYSTLGSGGVRHLFEKDTSRNTTYTYALVPPPISSSEANDLALLNTRGAQGFAFLYTTSSGSSVRLLFEKDNGRNVTYGYALAPPPASGNEADTLVLLNARGADGFSLLYGIVGSYGARYLLERAGSGAPAALASVSAASFTGAALSSEAIAAAFGTNLATSIQVADSIPLPTSLAGTTVKVKDSLSVERLASLFFVAPTQINYLIPGGMANGAAGVTVTSGNGSVSTGVLQIAAVAPGLFSANASGQGVAAAVALRVKADGSQSYEPVAQFDQAQQRFVATPIDLGPSGEQVYLLLYGTGFRNNTGIGNVRLTIGGMDVPVLYASFAPGFFGLDQINAGALPRSLAGRGELDVVLTVDGKSANTVRVSLR